MQLPRYSSWNLRSKWHLSLRVVCLLTVVVPLTNSLDAQDRELGELRSTISISSQPAVTAICTDWFEENASTFVGIYHWLHQNPEVSLAEEKTAEHLASLWRDYGYEVTTHVGGFGIVGILENGEGPTVMLRTDLDALPVTEETGLDYASKITVTSPSGVRSGVMHACGHDIHMTNVTAVAAFLAEHRELWQGRLMLIGQPAEELGEGALAMLSDGLFERFPKPDFAVALHVDSELEAGKIAVRSGFTMANVDSVDIKMKGRGGHGSKPESTIDPIVQAAELVMSLQTIVSREIAPSVPAVVTVGSIHGGTKHNIIGDSCHLQLTVRSYAEDIRNQVLNAIQRRANAIASAYDAPSPEIVISQGTPALENDALLTSRLQSAFSKAIGIENVLDCEPVMGGEDFSRYGLEGVPIVMYRLGVISPRRLQNYVAAGSIPSLHSSKFYPDLDPTLSIGFSTMTAGVLELMARDSTAR